MDAIPDAAARLLAETDLLDPHELARLDQGAAHLRDAGVTGTTVYELGRELLRVATTAEEEAEGCHLCFLGALLLADT